MKTIIWTSIVLLNLSFCGNPPKKVEKKETTLDARRVGSTF